VREKIARAVPTGVRIGVATGIGLVLAAFFLIRTIPGALILASLAVSILAFWVQTLGWLEGVVFVPDAIAAAPSLGTFLQLDLVGVTKVAGLVDQDGHPKNAGKALLVDGVSTTISGLFGSSPGTAYIESAAGVEQGGRSGLTAFIAMIATPFTYSITEGIVFGFIAHVVIRVLNGKVREISPTLWVIFAFSLAMLVM